MWHALKTRYNINLIHGQNYSTPSEDQQQLNNNDQQIIIPQKSALKKLFTKLSLTQSQKYRASTENRPHEQWSVRWAH